MICFNTGEKYAGYGDFGKGFCRVIRRSAKYVEVETEFGERLKAKIDVIDKNGEEVESAWIKAHFPYEIEATGSLK